MDIDDIYIQAEGELWDELGREPTSDEVAEKATEIYVNLSAAAYDRAKDRWKYGE